MIRYPVTKAQLEALITAETPDWLARATERTEKFRRKGFYEKERGPIWSEVKPVYMRLQGLGKCAYCERKMEAVEFGRSEQDVEHFHPKGSVKAWKAPRKLTVEGISFTDSPNTGKGYYLLPYHPFNYAAACKPCNSTLKRDYFPIGGDYHLDAEDPATLRNEKAYLLYPIGDLDNDPETLIEFHGTSPRPVATRGHQRHRALVTIEFFQLDAPDKRKNLYRDRALIITALFPLLQQTTQGSPKAKAQAEQVVEGFLKPELQQLNCARNFQRLFKRDAAEAEAIYTAALKFMTSISCPLSLYLFHQTENFSGRRLPHDSGMSNLLSYQCPREC